MAVQATASVYRDDERRVLGAQIAKLGVRLLNRYGRALQCEACEATWRPQPRPTGLSREVSGGVRTGAIGSGGGNRG